MSLSVFACIGDIHPNGTARIHTYVYVYINICIYIYICIIIYTYVHVWGKDPRKEKSVQRPQPIKMITTPLDISDDKLGFGSPRPLSFRRVYPIFQAQLWIGSWRPIRPQTELIMEKIEKKLETKTRKRLHGRFRGLGHVGSLVLSAKIGYQLRSCPLKWWK
jgi:hypothetical protein